jgi:hypothetical protein
VQTHLVQEEGDAEPATRRVHVTLPSSTRRELELGGGQQRCGLVGSGGICGGVHGGPRLLVHGLVSIRSHCRTKPIKTVLPV